MANRVIISKTIFDCAYGMFHNQLMYLYTDCNLWGGLLAGDVIWNSIENLLYCFIIYRMCRIPGKLFLLEHVRKH